MRLRFFLPAISLFLSGICLAQTAPDMPAADSSSLDFKQWGLLGIQDGGRRKPVDTFAREALIKISGRSTYTSNGKKWQGTDFILSMLLDTHDWKSQPMILVSLGELKQKLALPEQQRRFSFAQLAALPELNRLAGEAHALRKAEKPLSRLQSEVMSVSERLTLFANIMNGHSFLLVPAPEKTTDPWLVPPAFAQHYKEEQFAPIQTQLQTMANAYARADGFAFSRAANQLRDGLRQLSPKIYPAEKELRLEYFYNHFDGFYRAAWAYGIALLLLAIAHFRSSRRWIGRSAGDAETNAAAPRLQTSSDGALDPPRSYLKIAGVVIAIVGLLFHATAITLRCLIAGRPPVTNMYESIIWVSFAVLLFGMIFFARYRTSVYLLAALPVSLLSLLLVHQLPIAMPASIDPLVPVLRDNFWLTIHVLTITLSYAAFALAMGFGHILLWRYARNPVSARADQNMHFWLYRVLQLGVILLAAGTILGGVWANYSWGRFWGWDPKETWALIALLCYILTLHGRLAGWWTQFGLVVASVVCFLAVLMAWYGVNFVLGKGLHSYGFGLGGETYVVSFVIADLLFVAFATWRYRSSKGTPRSKAIGLILYGIGFIGLFALWAIVSWLVGGSVLWTTLVGGLLLGFLLPIFAYFNSLKREGRKHFTDAEVAPPATGMNFTLYLRSFQSDGDVTQFQHQAIVGFVRSTEEQIVRALEDVAPVYAIGRPAERLPELGARRLYFSDTEWQEAVKDFVQRADFIVMRVGATQALAWEVEHILQTSSPERFVLLVTRSDLRRERGDSQYEAFLERTSGFFPNPLPSPESLQGDVEAHVILFGPGWNPEPEGVAYKRLGETITSRKFLRV